VIAELLNELNSNDRAFILGVVRDFVGLVKSKKR
jgi:hypothetical protein